MDMAGQKAVYISNNLVEEITRNGFWEKKNA